MGLNNENAQRLVFDLETAPLPDAADYLNEEDFAAPANYKDPVKIAAYIQEAKLGAVAKCALDVDLCRIVAIGCWLEGRQVAAVTAQDAYEEVARLEQFWNLAHDRHIIGFNCLGFDLPVLLRRSLYLGVSVPEVQIDKYKHPRVSDLMEILSFGDKLRKRSLAFYCRRFGIDVPDGLKGADIGQAVSEGRWEAVEAHVRADVQKTAQLAARLSLFQLPVAV